MSESYLSHIHLRPVDNQRLANLCGQRNEHLQQVEQHFGVAINHRGHHFQISGQPQSVESAEHLIHELYAHTHEDNTLTPAKIHLFLQGKGEVKSMDHDTKTQTTKKSAKDIVFHTKGGVIRPYTDNQRQYVQNIMTHDINFCIGPAGTGKTFLAVACAVNALEQEIVQRILLVRPAVEAGENLGFLPGDLSQKVEPYLRPLYDALFEMMGFDRVGKLLEQSIIEIAPLAYMRGRTLNESFVILDESQNTTMEQMKMFLTRIGFGSKAIITGDITQIDLPKNKQSGLVEAMEVLKNVEGICFTHFDSKDVVRHNLVQRIVEAYERYQKQDQE